MFLTFLTLRASLRKFVNSLRALRWLETAIKTQTKTETGAKLKSSITTRQFCMSTQRLMAVTHSQETCTRNLYKSTCTRNLTV